MSRLRILWLNVDVAGPRDKAGAVFARHCDIDQADCAPLPSDTGLDHPMQVICFNYDYPDMQGLRLIPETKQRFPSIPIVMLTFQRSADLALWALRTRVFDLLTKPVTDQEVERCTQRLTQALQAKRSQSERTPGAMCTHVPAETRYRPQLAVGPRLQAATAYIAKHFARHITESEIASACGMAPSQFCREFKSTFGMTFLDYLCSYRVTEAKRLLVNPTMSIADVAVTVGFSDPSYFTRVFGRHAGISPTAYRCSVLAGDTSVKLRALNIAFPVAS